MFRLLNTLFQNSAQLEVNYYICSNTYVAFMHIESPCLLCINVEFGIKEHSITQALLYLETVMFRIYIIQETSLDAMKIQCWYL